VKAEVVGLRVDQKPKADILEGSRRTCTGPSYGKTSTSPFAVSGDRRAMAEGSSGGDLSGSMVESVFAWNLGRRRWDCANSLVHTSVERRLADESLGYTPSNLPAESLVSADAEKLLANRIAGQDV